MATLHLQNVPNGMYARLQQLAKAQNRSISAIALAMLESVLPASSQPPEEMSVSTTDILAEIRRRRRVRPADKGLADSTTLIREDRDNRF